MSASRVRLVAPVAAFVVAAFVLASATTTGTARADVVSPPPTFCMPGKVPVSDHRGSRCEPKAPDCPAGWVGVVGGHCVLDECDEGGGCRPGKHCVATDLCVEQRPKYWEWHRDGRVDDPLDRAHASTPAHRGPELAEPPPPLDPEHPVDVAVDICAPPRRTCASPKATCKPGKLCVPNGVNTAAARPTNAGINQGGATPVEKRGGCAGCTEASGASSARGTIAELGWIAIASLSAIVVTRRRARAHKPRTRG